MTPIDYANMQQSIITHKMSWALTLPVMTTQAFMDVVAALSAGDNERLKDARGYQDRIAALGKILSSTAEEEKP